MSPERLLPRPGGGWLVLDPAADIGHAGAQGVVFGLDATGAVDAATGDPAFRALTDMALDPQGRLWVSDAEADPQGSTCLSTI